MEDQENQESESNHQAVIAIVVVAIIAIVVVAGLAVSHKSSKTVAAANTSSTSANNTTSSAAATSGTGATAASFKDGTYKATGSYDSPGGNESITIDVTLSNGVITATSAQAGASDPEAKEYQNMFISGYKSQVVGKNITAVHLSSVSGSSLTSQGFNNAISQIENQAKA